MQTIGFPIAGFVGVFFVLVYLACIVALVIYILRLLGRFVGAHERVAGALETIARKSQDGGKP